VPEEYLDFKEGLPDPFDRLIGTRLDEHLLVRHLGEGGFGTVYVSLQMPVMMESALKLLKRSGDAASARARAEALAQEAVALSRLTHPNIVRLLKYGVFGDQPYMVTEYVKGGRELAAVMHQRARRKTGFSPEEVRHVVGQVLRALASAHEADVVHRDIKPQNIMLQTVNEDSLFVRILDFGLAKFVVESSDTSAIRGTPAYMAPEQIVCRNIGPWTDLYAVGIMLFEMLTGARAFSGLTARELYSAKLEPDYDIIRRAPVSELPDFVAAVIRTATATDVASRFASAKEFLQSSEDMFARLLEGGKGAGLLQTTVGSTTPASGAGEEISGDELAELETQSVSDVSAIEAVRGVEKHKGGTLAVARGRRWKRILAVLLIVMLVAGGLLLGSVFFRTSDGPFQISEHSKGEQMWPSVAAFKQDGRFVVAWASNHDRDSGLDIYARLYDSKGAELASPIAVNSTTSGDQETPAIATLSDGRFVVVWNSDGQDGDGWGIYAQRYAADASPQGAEFLVNTLHFRGKQVMPVIVALQDDSFVIAWSGEGEDDDSGVFAQVFDSSGKRVLRTTTVNPNPKGQQGNPDICVAGDDGFVVAWEDETDVKGGHWGILLQLFSADGHKRGEAFLANTHTQGRQRYPAVASLQDGRFVAAWTSEGQDGSGRGVYGQLFTSTGKKAGEEFIVNTTREGDQWIPAATGFPGGAFVVLWMSDGQDGDGLSVVGQFFDAQAGRIGDEFVLNTYVRSDQLVRSVSALGAYSYVTTWESRGEDGDGWGVFAEVRPRTGSKR